MQDLRSQPAQLAKWLTVGEQMADDHQVYLSLLESIVTGFYSSFIFSEDTKHMITLLYELAKLQLLDCDDPRRYFQIFKVTLSDVIDLSDTYYLLIIIFWLQNY